MAKVRFYCDVFPGCYPLYPLTAMTRPMHEKSVNATRVAFDVTIPDDVLSAMDILAPEPATLSIIERPDRPPHGARGSEES